MIALLDGDILVHEVGYAVQAKGFPEPFAEARDLLHMKVEQIMRGAGCTDERIFLSPESNFRYDIAKSKPYKGNRENADRPFHLNNLKAYLQHASPWQVSMAEGIEADDAIAMHATALGNLSVVCSRDKDLRQIPARFYQWEVGNQPQWSDDNATVLGYFTMEEGRLYGSGYLWFCSQWLGGDTADNIPGLVGCGPRRAVKVLEAVTTPEEAEEAVLNEYERRGQDIEYATEQAQLVWLCRRWQEEGEDPQLWHRGLYR